MRDCQAQSSDVHHDGEVGAYQVEMNVGMTGKGVLTAKTTLHLCKAHAEFFKNNGFVSVRVN